MTKPLQDLIEISSFAAKHPDWVQGGGGNCSVKFDGKMSIKSSGYFLEDVSPRMGYVTLDLSTGKIVGEPAGKASMETPLHTLLGQFVIHTHPVAVVALVSSKEGRTHFKTLFPNDSYAWISYASPGRDIYEKVKEALSPEMIQGDLVLFLQNHGLFVSSSLKQRAIDLHQQVVDRLEVFFGKVEISSEIPPHHYLTPDHAVYAQKSQNEFSDKQKTAYEETIFLARSAAALIREKGWEPSWLSAEETAAVLNMSDEKYRQQLWGKK